MIDWPKYKPSSCSGCTLLHQPGPCWGEGDPQHAKVIYISEKPGNEETNARPMRPFVGAAGRVLNGQFREAGVNRVDFFITNQVKCLCPGNREPTEQEVECCRPLLQRELDRCNRADTVLLAGAIAFNAHIGSYSTLSDEYSPSTSIFERMGCVEQRHGRKWIGTPHPAFIMRILNVGGPIIQDAVEHIRKAVRLSSVKVPLPTVICWPTEEEIERHRQAALTRGIFADDCETYVPADVTDEDLYADDSWKMDLGGVSAIPYEAIILDRAQMAGGWGDIWANPDLIQAEQNGEYDRYYFGQVAPQRNRRYDTMLGHHLLHSNDHKYLKPNVLRTYTNLPYYNRDLEGATSRRFYCGIDNITTLLAAMEQMRQMAADGYIDVRGLEGEVGKLHRGRMYDLYWGRAFAGEPGLGRILPLMEEQRRVGLRVDLRKALLMHRWLDTKVRAGERQIGQMLGPLFNWRSYGPNGDVQRLFYQTWRLPGQYNQDKKTREKKLTCDADAREKLGKWVLASGERKIQYAEAARYFTIVNEIATYSKLQEFVERIQVDLRLHPLNKAHGTISFRIATKPNQQNWPTWPITTGMDSMRSIVVADNPEDDLILSCDFDQVELWTYMAQFNVAWLWKVYESGDYIYGAYAEDMLHEQFFQVGMPRTKKYKLDSVTDEQILRYKAGPLGFLYGRSGESVAAEKGWPAQEGVRLREAYFTEAPEIPAGHEWIQAEMKRRRKLRPPPGMILHYPVPDLQGINCFGQTPAAVLLWTSMILIDAEIKRRRMKNTRIMLSVHDSIAINVGGARKDPTIMQELHDEIVVPTLTRPIPWLGGFRYRHSSKVGTMWDWKMQDYDKWVTTTQ